MTSVTELGRAFREDGYPAGVPEVAIVLHSPAARFEDTRYKIRKYLDCCARSVWLVNAQEEIVFVLKPGREQPLLFSAGQVLYLPEPLPQVGIPIEEIFAWDW